jgi:mono/diheme cytochrome c family protein
VLAVAVVLLIAATVWQQRGQGGPVVINDVAAPPLPTLDGAQVAAGEPLYGQYCAACHGAELEGQPNWRAPLPSGLYPAPPHDESGHTWHHDDALLMQIVRDGGTRTPNGMPGFREQLTDEQIHAILTYIKSTWGREEREFQWWVTATRE